MSDHDGLCNVDLRTGEAEDLRDSIGEANLASAIVIGGNNDGAR
jgi:hypothetical protein